MKHGLRVCFLPYDFRRRKQQRRTNSLCAAMFLVTIAAIGVSVAVSERSLHAAEADHDDVSREFTSAALRIEQLRQLQDRERHLTAHATAAAALVETIPRSCLIAEVTNALPPGVTLTDLSFDCGPRGSANADPRHAIARVRLSGTGQSEVQIAQFVNQLSRSDVLKDVVLNEDLHTPAATTPVADGQPRSFAVDLSLAGVAVINDDQASTAVELSPE